MGCEPDEIELIHIEKRVVKHGRSKSKPTAYYFYRFRTRATEFSESGEWLVGMSGGFQSSKGGVHKYTYDTFSHFKLWQEHSIEQHVAMYLNGNNEMRNEQL